MLKIKIEANWRIMLALADHGPIFGRWRVINRTSINLLILANTNDQHGARQQEIGSR
jgi:hypothetical protein